MPGGREDQSPDCDRVVTTIRFRSAIVSVTLVSVPNTTDRRSIGIVTVHHDPGTTYGCRRAAQRSSTHP